MSWLKVSEAFYSIQGEGATMGAPAVFLRLTACNLLCQSDSWVCDTIEVWKRGKRKEFANVLPDAHVQRLKEGAHLVITGGEPLLQQERLIEYIEYLQGRVGRFYVEVETNGTIVPAWNLLDLVNQWNCSPKLKNSGETWERRYNELAIKSFVHQSAWFKFVISQQSDFQEILQDWHIKGMKIILMPAGETQEELNNKRQMVIELARDIGVRYSDRLHIVAWNKKTGV